MLDFFFNYETEDFLFLLCFVHVIEVTGRHIIIIFDIGIKVPELLDLLDKV